MLIKHLIWFGSEHISICCSYIAIASIASTVYHLDSLYNAFMFFLEFESAGLTFFVWTETVNFVKHWNIPQNIYFCVLLKKFNHSGLEQHEGK